ncbi:MAG: site-specific integrase [Clostridia bacterium]|nr:site-specific integrase [Clostridia bacterium]
MAKNSKKRSIGHVKKLADNKYLLRLSLGFDDFGKRIQPSKVVVCSSDREAEKMLLEFYNERESLLINHNATTPKTLGQLFEYWKTNHIQKNLRGKTAEWYGSMWENHVKYAEKVKLDVLTPAHIIKIIDAVDGCRMQNAVFKMLKAMINKGVKWGFVSTNPCLRVDTPQYKAVEKNTLTEAEILRLSKAVDVEETKYKAIFYFAILCGMRRQEIVALKWSDVDFANNCFKICRAASHLTGKGTIAGETKTEKSVRILFLPDMLKKILLELNVEQSRIKFMYGNKWVNEDWIFTQNNGKIMHIQTPTHWWKEFANANGVENVTFHGLRHTAASFMIKNNVPISTVSSVLGHANITTTLNTYTHVIEDTKQMAINTMAGIVQKMPETIKASAAGANKKTVCAINCAIDH